jgi:hypothetical protein
LGNRKAVRLVEQWVDWKEGRWEAHWALQLAGLWVEKSEMPRAGRRAGMKARLWAVSRASKTAGQKGIQMAVRMAGTMVASMDTWKAVQLEIGWAAK